MKMIDPWETLHVAPGDSADDLKQAYRRAMLAAHPDREGGSEEKARDINRAHDFLRRNLVDNRVPSPEQVGIARPAPQRTVVHFRPQTYVFSPYSSASTTSTTSAFGNAAPFVVFISRG